MPNPRNSNSTGLEGSFVPSAERRQSPEKRQEVLRGKLEGLKKRTSETGTKFNQPSLGKNLSEPNQGKIAKPPETPTNREQKSEISAVTNKEIGSFQETKEKQIEKQEEKEQFREFDPGRNTGGNRIKFSSKTGTKKKKGRKEKEEQKDPLQASKVLKQKGKVVLNASDYEKALFLILQHFRHSEE
jgi:hypothetical protein